MYPFFLQVLIISIGFVIGHAFSACECLDRIVLLHNVGDFRLITSPNYPEPYCPGMDCHWHIVAPNNKSNIQFSADNLDLRKNIDQITFHDYRSRELLENKTESHKCSGDDLCYYTSKFQYLTVRFKTSPMEDIDNFGFQAVITIRDKFGASNTSKTFASLFLFVFPFLLFFLCFFLY